MTQGRIGDMKIKLGFVILFLFSSAILPAPFSQQNVQDQISGRILKDKPIDKCLISRVEIHNPFQADGIP